MFFIRIKFKRIGALIAALMLSLALCCTTAFAAPAYDDSGAGSDAQVDVVDDAPTVMDGTEDGGDTEAVQDSNPFGKSYIIKGVAVVGVGVVFYVVLSLKSKKK